VDLRGQKHTPEEGGVRFGKRPVGFITDKPSPGYLTVAKQAGGQVAQLVAAIREDAPKGDTLAVFAGVAESRRFRDGDWSRSNPRLVLTCLQQLGIDRGGPPRSHIIETKSALRKEMPFDGRGSSGSSS